MAEVINLLGDNPKPSKGKLTNHVKTTESLMRMAVEKGWTLAYLCDAKVMDRSLRTLQKRARQFDLQFSDYVPRKLKPKKARK